MLRITIVLFFSIVFSLSHAFNNISLTWGNSKAFVLPAQKKNTNGAMYKINAKMLFNPIKVARTSAFALAIKDKNLDNINQQEAANISAIVDVDNDKTQQPSSTTKLKVADNDIFFADNVNAPQPSNTVTAYDANKEQATETYSTIPDKKLVPIKESITVAATEDDVAKELSNFAAVEQTTVPETYPGQYMSDNTVVPDNLPSFNFIAVEANCLGDEQLCVGNFKVSDTEITNYAYRNFKPNHNSGENLNDDYQPVVNINRQEIIDYIEWLSDKHGVSYSLPTKKQWDYMIIASKNSVTCEYANLEYCGNNNTLQVRATKPNTWQLYDLFGNVAETVINKQGMIAVGGSYLDNDTIPKHHIIKSNNIGFRLVINN